MKFIRKNKRNYFFSLIVMFFLMLLFYNSFYWESKGIGERKILEGIIIFVGLFFVPFLIVRVSIINSWIGKQIDCLLGCFRNIMVNWKRVIQFIIYIITIILVSCGISCLLDKMYYHTEYNIYRFLLISVFNFVIFCLFVFKKYFINRQEIAFLIVALSLGVLFIEMTPATVGISWDDEIHYKRTLHLSNALNGIMFEADQKNIDEYVYRIGEHLGFDRTSNEMLSMEYNKLYENKGTVPCSFEKYSIKDISYLPSAIGIIIGRGLRLSYTSIFKMGKFFNLIMYVMLFYFAIKKLPQGKIFVSTIGLIPSLLFMASSYSYDSWLVGWVVLGYSYYFTIVQQDNLYNTKDIIFAVLSITLGCFPKAVYFPLLFPLLFASRDKFKDSKQRKFYYILVVLCGLILVTSIVLPMMIDPQSQDDIRGGAEVSALGQLQFIFENPIHYTKILTTFLSSYLAIENMSYFQFMAYAGNGNLWGIIVIVIFVVAFLDCGGKVRVNNKIKITTLIGVLGGIILVPTTLYLAFTPVGAETIAGCQYRYIFPLLFPLIYVIGNNNVHNKINKEWFTIIPIIIIMIACMNSINTLFVVSY